MTYSLTRERDGAGDSGGMSMIFFHGENGDVVSEQFARPKVGAVIRVGSLYGRSYAGQDYWTTTKITEILEDTENRVRFKTGNSTYVWEIL